MASQQAMQKTSTRFICFPRTDPPPSFAERIVGMFREHDVSLGTQNLSKGLTSNEVLNEIRTDLVGLGFEVETGKEKNTKIHRPVFFGEDGEPTLRYGIDAYHREWSKAL